MPQKQPPARMAVSVVGGSFVEWRAPHISLVGSELNTSGSGDRHSLARPEVRDAGQRDQGGEGLCRAGWIVLNEECEQDQVDRQGEDRGQGEQGHAVGPFQVGLAASS